MTKLAPSILSADFARLGEQIQEAEAAGVDYLHIDVMDGHFVPNITIGPVVVNWLRPLTKLPFDVHLMIESPDTYIPDFANAGADIILVHQETCPHLHRTIQHIKGFNKKAGVVLNPATPIHTLEEILPFIDQVLLMSVNPGFGGQSFIETTVNKIARLRQMIAARGLAHQIEIEVDGGINAEIAPRVVQAGAQILVAGSAVFNKKESITQAIQRLKNSIQ
jgi:ribulose-phosphate 3-epimerase